MNFENIRSEAQPTPGDQNRRGNVASVAATLTALGADDVDAGLECLPCVLGSPDHVHDGDPGGVELVDGPLGGDSD